MLKYRFPRKRTLGWSVGICTGNCLRVSTVEGKIRKEPIVDGGRNGAVM